MTYDITKLIIAIDGPAGSGKSTIASQVAEKLNGRKLDTGAIYRSFALYAASEGITDYENTDWNEVVKGFNLEFKAGGEIILNGRRITDEIRTPENASAASRIAVIPGVRAALLDIQRTLALPGPTVCEGRDMGSVVFPDSPWKFFLTATPEVRARRRYMELKEKGASITYEEVLEQQIERDKRDSERDVAPLKPTPDAEIIDSSIMSIPAVVSLILSRLKI